MQVAKEILNQLGGNKFLAMTGAHSLWYDKNTLGMKLRNTTNKAKGLTIELKSDDTYTMKFYSQNAKTFEVKVVGQFEGVYCDMLQEIFTNETGLYTSLGTMKG